MEMPLVSVALCTYNGAEYLQKQLDSIIGQTFKNIEVVIVDDCSTDGTFDMVQEYAARHSIIKCYRNETTLGFNKNFEKAIEYTLGQYIAICDQDDIWLPQKIEALLNAIGDNWMVFSNSACMDNKDALLHKNLLTGFEFEGRNYRSMLLASYVTGHTSLFSRKFLPHMLPFPANGFYDWWMGFTALYNHKLVYLDKVLTLYRIHTQSVVQVIKTGGAKFSQFELQNLKTMLQNFTLYKNLRPADREFIQKLFNLLHTNKAGINTGLIKLLYANYDDLFPELKKRKGLSKLGFAIRYAKYLMSKR